MNHFSRNRVEDRVSFPSFDSLHTHTHNIHWVSVENMEGEGEKKKRRRRDRLNREREIEGEGLRVRKRVASGRGAPRRSREERACAPVLSGAHLSVLSRDVHPPHRHAFLCVRAFTTARMVHIRGARSELASRDRRIEGRGGGRTMRVSTQRARMKGRVFSGKGQRYRPRNGNVASEGRCDDVTTRR